jgi:outer membrane protein OmpA-like peptidoglycan-associated protein
MKSLLPRFSRPAVVLATALVLGACASAPSRNATLDEARIAYDRAATDAAVVRSAPVELRRAQQALQQAESALRDGKEVADVDYFATLARQRTEVAFQAGKVAQAEMAAADAAKQRDRILIDSRTSEADTQRALAEKARLQAEAERKLAEDRLAAVQSSQAQTQAERARSKTLEMQLADLKAKQTDRGMVLTLGDVLFDTGRAELKSGATRSIEQLAAFLKENSDRAVAVEGYTDSVGSDDLNQVLSERRALAVKNALVDRGITANRITSRGLGKASPVVGNDTAAGRQQNRRVEIVIANKAG